MEGIKSPGKLPNSILLVEMQLTVDSSATDPIGTSFFPILQKDVFRDVTLIYSWLVC